MSRICYETSSVTGKTYDLFSIIRIMNPKQAAFYCSKGLEIQDIEISEDRKTKEPVLVFYFLKDETKEPFDEWCRRREALNKDELWNKAGASSPITRKDLGINQPDNDSGMVQLREG